MKNYHLIWNPMKHGTKEMSETIRGYLEKRKCKCEDFSEDTDCIITLGGDGTLIRAARSFCGYGVPLIGINMGSLGYLTQVGCGNMAEISKMLDNLIEQKFRLEKRMMLKGSVVRRGAVVSEGIVLNDISVAGQGAPRIRKIKIYVNGTFLTQCRADGLIIATPTGSTAYNLSAGGPIAAPSAEMIILTPVCSQDLAMHSIVFSPEDNIEIEALEDQLVVFDGDEIGSFMAGDRLKIERSLAGTIFVKLKEVSFVEDLRCKLMKV